MDYLLKLVEINIQYRKGEIMEKKISQGSKASLSKEAYQRKLEYNRNRQRQAKVRKKDLESRTRIGITLNNKAHADVLEWINSQGNRTQYIVDLIRKDMKKKGH